jgi:hypothetical protein
VALRHLTGPGGSHPRTAGVFKIRVADRGEAIFISAESLPSSPKSRGGVSTLARFTPPLNHRCSPELHIVSSWERERWWGVGGAVVVVGGVAVGVSGWRREGVVVGVGGAAPSVGCGRLLSSGDGGALYILVVYIARVRWARRF